MNLKKSLPILKGPFTDEQHLPLFLNLGKTLAILIDLKFVIELFLA